MESAAGGRPAKGDVLSQVRCVARPVVESLLVPKSLPTIAIAIAIGAGGCERAPTPTTTPQATVPEHPSTEHTSAEATAAPSVASMPALDAPTEPTSAAPLSTPALPPWKAFTSAGHDGDWTAPNKATSREWLGEDAAVAVIRTGTPEGRSWRLSVVRLGRDGHQWSVTGVKTIHEWDTFEDLGRDGSVSVHLETGDFDDDGGLEIAVRYRLPMMCRAVGASVIRNLVILSDDEELSEAAYVELDSEIYRGKRIGRERFEDRNDDGHADLVIAWRWTSDEGDDDRGEYVHLWQPNSDAFAGAERPVDEEDIDCS